MKFLIVEPFPLPILIPLWSIRLRILVSNTLSLFQRTYTNKTFKVSKHSIGQYTRNALNIKYLELSNYHKYPEFNTR